MHKLLTSRKFQTVVMIMCMVMAFSSIALANTSNGTEFNALYTRVIGWITGLPAIIIAFAFAIIGVVRSFQSGGFIWALAGILIGALLFILPSIVTGLGGATI
jgi:hypothetical protein